MNFSYEELLEKYNLLLEENRNLKREITILTGQSKITPLIASDTDFRTEKSLKQTHSASV